MKLIFETCQPRKDVLTGDLKEEMFAAHLRDVIDAKADPIYRDPAVFFEHTYPTEGIKSLLQGALGRLSGAKPTNAPFTKKRSHTLTCRLPVRLPTCVDRALCFIPPCRDLLSRLTYGLFMRGERLLGQVKTSVFPT